MTKEEARSWMSGWELLADKRRSDKRNESYEDRFRALAFLMASVDLFDMKRLNDEDVLARERWALLQSIAGRR